MDGPPDPHTFEEAARRPLEDGDQAAVESAIGLYGGDLLPEDPYESWAVTRREELRQLFLSLQERIADLSEQQGDSARSIEALERIVAAEPTEERIHRRLMRLFAGAGSRHKALRQYARATDHLSPTRCGTSRAVRSETCVEGLFGLLGVGSTTLSR